MKDGDIPSVHISEIGRQLAKAAATAADRVPESTPEERAEIARHVAAIYRILRDATVRRGGVQECPMLMLGPATPNDNQTQRMETASRWNTPVQAHFSSVQAAPE